MQKCRNKLKSRRGVSVFLVLTGILLVIAILLIVLIPGYMDHLKDAKMTYDVQSVETAKEVALVEYMQSAGAGLVMYWYDELSHKVVATKEEAAAIKGYGRSSQEQNRGNVSGAAGVPCLPQEDGGPQLLCMTVSGDSINNIWWSGNRFTYWDYFYMDQTDRTLLKQADYREMDSSSESMARSRARADYEKRFKKQLKKGENPGELVYNYDLIQDVLFLDPSMPADSSAAALDEADKAQLLPASSISAYSLSEPVGSIVQVRVDKDNTDISWVEGRHGT